MQVNLSPFLYLWLALVAVVIVLFGRHQLLARKEDDSLHVGHDGNVPAQQVALAKKIDQVDKVGKLLTVIAVAFGIILGVLAIVQAISSPGTSGV